MALVAVCAVVLTLVRFLFIDNWPDQVLLSALCALDGSATVYVRGYSESKFRSLRIGMTAHQVEQIMGPPLSRSQWATTRGGIADDVWNYTGANQPLGDYKRRSILFRNGKVFEIYNFYYLD
jgi:hypothetical protein